MSAARGALFAGGITVGALLIRFGLARIDTPLVQVLLQSEVFHVSAHLFLYGTVAWLLSARFSGWRVVALTLAAGVVQELAQVVGTRGIGRMELFDLGVDGVAAVAVLGVRRWAQRRRGERR